MRNQNGNKNESPANTRKTFYQDADGTGLYEIRFSYKQTIPGSGFLMKNGKVVLEASTRGEAKELFESLPASKGLKITVVRQVQNAIVWTLEA
jgi:hypothetical protein